MVKLLGVITLFILLLAGPATLAVARAREHAPWSSLRWDSAGLAPDPARHPEAVVQVYCARSWGWKGAFSLHCWVALKPEGARAFERYDVVGWGVGSGRPALRRDIRPVDGYWAGNRPEIVGDLRGAEAAAAIPKLRRAIAAYPYAATYRIWPGPNSNSFVAWMVRAVPELGFAVPAHAVGRDWLPWWRPVALTPSGTGLQLSLWGLAGVAVGVEEGLEVNLLGLVLGVDPKHLAVKLPGIGSVGLLNRGEPPRTPVAVPVGEPGTS